MSKRRVELFSKIAATLIAGDLSSDSEVGYRYFKNGGIMIEAVMEDVQNIYEESVKLDDGLWDGERKPINEDD